tara:strand:- start:884 stop:1135 length:252 start_codon:yes stop_codon:yes gene_type:complete
MDNNPVNEYPNISAISTVMRIAASFKVLYCVSEDQFTHSRGVSFLSQLGSFAALLTNEGCNNAADFMIPVITKSTKGGNKGRL